MQYRIEKTGTHTKDGHAFLVVSFWHDGGPPAAPDLVNDFLIQVHTLPTEPKFIVDARGRRQTQDGHWTQGWLLVNDEWERVENPDDPWVKQDVSTIEGYAKDVIEEWYWQHGFKVKGSITDHRLPAQCGAAKGKHAPLKALEGKAQHGIGRNRSNQVS